MKDINKQKPSHKEMKKYIQDYFKKHDIENFMLVLYDKKGNNYYSGGCGNLETENLFSAGIIAYLKQKWLMNISTNMEDIDVDNFMKTLSDKVKSDFIKEMNFYKGIKGGK